MASMCWQIAAICSYIAIAFVVNVTSLKIIRINDKSADDSLVCVVIGLASLITSGWVRGVGGHEVRIVTDR